MIRRFALASAILITAGYAAPAMAGTATSDINVSATVISNCSISTTPLAFGDYDPLVTHATTHLDATATVTTTCSNGRGTYIRLGQGANAATGSTNVSPGRRLKNSGNGYINYNIYQNSARTTNWGNTVDTSPNVTGTGSAQVTTIYGRIPAGQAADATTYSDTVVATVEW
ncbi:spore coat protein U domain-containing protein [Sphaerospermopsis sp. FACHB-1094]|uniref:Csu type fimbrial protein n=1 Tax=Sphaerospermopsis sp. FACHB-1094 TaxID=2692861 RepID=UPI0016871FEA|nr:spore coat U domain-containing protein [Sphaerospermopsis sp. FACHB-1094]MBD2131755.1 spore coat protein U domain-containing protein [Sphaerospermopsis sp. FACHB-1094]